MIFSSPQFVFIFLPFVLFLYYAVSKFNKQHFTLYLLILASFVFYGLSSLSHCLIFASSIILNYFFSWATSTYRMKCLVFFAVAFNLCLLGYYKYLGFFGAVLGYKELSLMSLVLPLGISFYTFQQIAYQVDIYKKNISLPSFGTYAFFVSFFPQLVAGPIVNFKNIHSQIQNLRRPEFLNLVSGFVVFMIGLFKKTLIADQLAPMVNKLFSLSVYDAGTTFISGWSYGMQLYYDFSGYADMAIGLGMMFGIILPINFNSPYKSKNIQEFWRRWHITLSNFLKEYLYIPFGGNRHGALRQYLALFSTMLLGGLWHGAGWNFILWGGIHGGLLVLCVFWKKWRPFNVPGAIAWAVTFSIIMIAWVPFRATDTHQLHIMLEGLAHFGAGQLTNVFSVFGKGYLTFSDPYFILVVATLLAVLLPNSTRITFLITRDSRIFIPGFFIGIIAFAYCLNLAGSPTQAFLYFNF